MVVKGRMGGLKQRDEGGVNEIGEVCLVAPLRIFFFHFFKKKNQALFCRCRAQSLVHEGEKLLLKPLFLAQTMETR